MTIFDRYYSFLISIFLIFLFLVVSVQFSFHQNLWVDESTQLSGIRLSLFETYRWLSGMGENPFLVPADRMPILSYVAGYIWSNLFGTDQVVMRWLSIFAVLLGLIFIFYSLLKRTSADVLLATLIFLCLSSNLIITAVEIRAYALFFLLSSVATILYMSIILSCENHKSVEKNFLYLALVLALAINTHFFGVVLACSILGSYLILHFIDNRVYLNKKIALTVIGIIFVAILLVLPQILASIGISKGNAGAAVSSNIISLVRLVYRLVSHMSMGDWLIVPIVATSLVYGSILFSSIKYPKLIKNALLLTLILGGSAAFTAKLVTSGFEPLAAHYNIWMLAVLALLFAFCVADFSAVFRIPILAILALCLAWGPYNLYFSGEKYAHTRFNKIRDQVNVIGAENNIAIIYNEKIALTWFAGLYYFDEKIKQYIKTKDGYVNLRTKKLTPQNNIISSSQVIISAYGKTQYSNDVIAGQVQKKLADDSPVHNIINLNPTSWKVTSGNSYLALESLDLIVYQKI